MKTNYKQGDRVIGVEEMDGNAAIIGLKGRILTLNTQEENPDSDCLVEFDVSFPDGHSGTDRGRDGHCWYVHFRCIKPLKQKFELGDVVKIMCGVNKYKVGVVNDYTNDEGNWPVNVDSELVYYKPRYLVLAGRKQLI